MLILWFLFCLCPRKPTTRKDSLPNWQEDVEARTRNPVLFVLLCSDHSSLGRRIVNVMNKYESKQELKSTYLLLHPVLKCQSVEGTFSTNVKLPRAEDSGTTMTSVYLLL